MSICMYEATYTCTPSHPQVIRSILEGVGTITVPTTRVHGSYVGFVTKMGNQCIATAGSNAVSIQSRGSKRKPPIIRGSYSLRYHCPYEIREAHKPRRGKVSSSHGRGRCGRRDLSTKETLSIVRLERVSKTGITPPYYPPAPWVPVTQDAGVSALEHHTGRTHVMLSRIRAYAPARYQDHVHLAL